MLCYYYYVATATQSNPRVSQGNDQVATTWSQHGLTYLLVTEDKTEGSKTRKEAATESGLAEGDKARNTAVGDVHEFWVEFWYSLHPGDKGRERRREQEQKREDNDRLAS